MNGCGQSAGIPCTVQVLDENTLEVQPFSDVIIDVTPGRIEEPGSVEAFDIALQAGKADYAFLFTTPKASDQWDITGHIENVVDGTVQPVAWIITARSKYGFTIWFAALPETGNTHFRGTVRDRDGSVGDTVISSSARVVELPSTTSLALLAQVSPNNYDLSTGRTVFVVINGQGEFFHLESGTVEAGDVAVYGNPGLRWRQVI